MKLKESVTKWIKNAAEDAEVKIQIDNVFTTPVNTKIAVNLEEITESQKREHERRKEIQRITEAG